MFLPSTITLKPGDSGDFVTELQRRLSKVGFHDEAAINGMYDGVTTTSVRSFQSANGLQSDGIAGPETIRRLNGAVTGSTDTTTEGSSSEDEQKETDRLTLKDSILSTVAQEPALDPALMGMAAEANTQAEAPKEPDPAIKDREAAVQREAQAKAAESAQANIQQQSQLQEMLMQALQNKQPPAAEQPTKEAQPVKQENEAAKAVQKDAKALEAAAMKEQMAQQNPELAAQKDQALQQKEQMAQQTQQEEAQAKQQEVAQKPERTPMLQKLVDYIEARLPTDTVREVLQVGGKMLRAGVQQASMPDDGTARAPETGQAQSQEQAAQRG